MLVILLYQVNHEHIWQHKPSVCGYYCQWYHVFLFTLV